MGESPDGSIAVRAGPERTGLILVVDIQMEFNVVIPESEIQHGKWNDPVRGFSVRRLAELVAAHMRPE